MPTAHQSITNSEGMPIKVLNSRPNPMGAELSDLLAIEHIHSIDAPVIQNQALPLEKVTECSFNLNTLAELKKAFIECINQTETIWLFISKSSVQFFQQFIQSMNTEFVPHGHVIAVGETTKQALLTLNKALSVLTPEHANSESLLLMRELKNCEALMLVKGEGGRGLIREHVEQNGAHVIELDLYHRQAKNYALEDIKVWTKADCILATSVDIASSLLHNITRLPNENKQDMLQTKPWIVLSDRIKQFLIAQGVNKHHIYVCEHSDNSSIIKMIKLIGKAGR